MYFRGYLFDLDGTLVDSVRLILDSFHHTRQVHFGDALPEATFLETLGMPLRDIFGRMATDAVTVKALIETYVAFNLEHHDAMVRAYEGAVSALATLAARGARIGVVTSKMNAHAWRGLEVCGLRQHVELLVGADDVTRAKPDPEPVRRALETLALAPEETVFVGDSPHDVASGNAAGVATAAATWGPFSRASLEAAGPTFWLTRFQEVLELVRPGT
jgi:pyrophosphatase PpaX